MEREVKLALVKSTGRKLENRRTNLGRDSLNIKCFHEHRPIPSTSLIVHEQSSMSHRNSRSSYVH